MRVLLATLLWLVAVRTRAAPQPHDLDVQLAASTGQVSAPFFTTHFPRAVSGAGQARLIALRIGAALPHSLHGELQMTAAHVGVEQPAGSYRFAWLASHLALALGANVVRRGVHVLRVGGGLALPLHGALGDSLHRQRAYAIANGLTGLLEQELFTPGTVVLLSSVRWQAALRRGCVEGELKLPLFVRVSDVALPAASTRAIALSPVASIGGTLALTRRLALGLRALAVGNWLGPVADPRSDVLHFVFAPSLTLLHRRRLAPDASLRASVPVGEILVRTFQLGLALRWQLDPAGRT